MRSTLRFGDACSDHMVLQRGVPLPVWGFGLPGDEVRVTFAGQEAAARVDRAGRWTAQLAPLEANAHGQPLTVRSGALRLQCRDVLVGDVWLCAGQSNMELGVGSADHRDHALTLADNPLLRLLLVQKSSAPTAQAHFPPAAGEPRWAVCTPRRVQHGGWGGFSAAAFHFGARLVRELGVPVGLIQAAYGGSRIAPFIPLSAKRGHPALQADAQEIRAADQAARNGPHPFTPFDAWNTLKPGTAWNAMIAPLLPLALRGALWYQGESDVGDAGPYAARLRALMTALRRATRHPHLPVYAAQLAPYRYGRDEDLLDLWAAQQAATRGTHSGLVCTADLGDLNDIHPRRKAEVGERLAGLALHREYRRSDLPATGPELRAVRFGPGRATLTFRTHADSPLRTLDGGAARGFALAGPDGTFHPATPTLRGPRVHLHSPDVPAPTLVRHAWQVGAEPNLTDAGGLPGLPFLHPPARP
ncbi:sialate O-acetylesterase [Deinococcus aquiradiocola]|uniref:sialate O-acetylesterase n=1 Tax=Deinococcus aquiradiocola TaxID=393059 RepID=UPI00166819BB|nr:sialate O-acetylesterase [Deinococcus aquiradiocola]